MWGWYRDVTNRPPPLARVSLYTLTAEGLELYTHVPPQGWPIPIEVAPFWGGDADTSTLRQRPVWHAVRTPQVVALCREVGGRPRPRKMVEGCHHHPCNLKGRRTHGVVCLANSGDYPPGGRHRLQIDWTGGGAVEENIRHHQSPDIVLHPVPWCSTWFLRQERNRDRHTWV